MKKIAIVLVIILVLNMILLALEIIGPLIFWAVIIIIAILTYKVLPRFSKKPL